MKYEKTIFIILSFLFCFPAIANEIKLDKNRNTEFSVYTGVFDFSDDGKRATLIGFQHQNEELKIMQLIFILVYKLNINWVF